ncbi:GUN4 N-terminal ARM-like repeat domain-containing protein [Crocosphaera sp. XPORK-15E]|uniref:GUN4 N-terminal ARM-like repeat domain-containing protein n=1 Tax=Crocosphaera sp. XPORK-15E TaxID=3110247 RepID=UPI002B1F865F|nr:GUN4 N-terminal ARM-like repeat domain-containing protein [Crocosphaera sp. XPORK-15E]MEA5533575.1 GUN4 N-terminal ARM-like repeat domain-containing protein [Crocosphaera sp. XPORK-15E]
MTDQQSAILNNTNDQLSSLTNQWVNGSVKDQLPLIPQLIALGEPGLDFLITFLQSSELNRLNVVRGKIYQGLYEVKSPKTQEFIQTYGSEGIIPLKSERNVDYRPLNQLLIEQNFQEADTLTRYLLCELGGEGAVQRKWVYFTEVEQFPVTDLYTINSLWWVYSEGKFGFSVQRKLWLSVGKDFNKLWPKIGWKKDNNWTQFPNQFTWDLSAPVGHLPLLNQLRGVRVAAALFAHPVWTENNWE